MKLFLKFLLALAAVMGLTVPHSVRAANQSWSNAPADNLWNNALNWSANGVPGTLNTVNNDVATFTNAIGVLGIGSITNPILFDSGRSIGSMNFDTTACGAYVFGTNDGVTLFELSATGTPTPTNFTFRNITINPAVTNPISFLGITQSRLGSSANGAYSFTNNATSPVATLFFNQIFNTSANTRPLDLVLGGSNTGTNTIASIQDNAGASGAIQIDKVGTGTWIIQGANDMPQKTSAGNIAHVSITNGTLIAQNAGAFGSITTPNFTINSAGVLQLDGVTLNQAAVTLQNGGTIRMNGSATLNGITVGNAAGTVVTIATTSPTDLFTIGNAATKVIGGAADTVAHLTGPGTNFLAFSSTYIGRWSIDTGVTQVGDAAALGTGAFVSIAQGATLDFTPLATLGFTDDTISTASLSAAGTGTGVGSTASTIMTAVGATIDLQSKPVTLTFAPTSASGDTTHPALFVSQGTLSINGNGFTVNNTSGTPLGVGTYLLIKQATGNIVTAGGPFAVVTGAGLAAGTVGEIAVVNGSVNLVVSPHVSASLVWEGGNPDNTWDKNSSANFLNGGTFATFGTSDSVLFNGVGSNFSNVNLVGTLLPKAVTVDTTTNNYTFGGAGQIAGGASLTKIGTGTFVLATANSYSGGTIISNGTLQIGVANALPSTGGDVTVKSPSLLDLNGNSIVINGLLGDGTVDITNGATATLTIGENGDSGTFTGIIRNTSGVLGLTKDGNGTETLGASNSFAGLTTLNAGTLKLTNANALGAGLSPVTVNSGILDISTNVVLASLNSVGGVVSNSATTTNILSVLGGGTNTALITGRVSLAVNGGTFRLETANNYTGLTTVGGGATLAFGNAGQTGTNSVILSNNASVSMPPTSGNSPAVAANFTTVTNATATITSASTASSYNGNWIGSTNSTNIFLNGNMSIGGTFSFSNFLGTIIITNAEVRWFAATVGGDAPTWVFTNGGGCFTRDADTVRLGALFGNGLISAPSVTAPGTYLIGGKNTNCNFEGTISGGNNITKIGTANLTLDGGTFFTNIVEDNIDPSIFYTNVLASSAVLYAGITTISNGTLTVALPSDLSASSPIVLAGTGAILDTSRMGFIDITNGTNSIYVTNNTLTLNPSLVQSLNGFGTISGNVIAPPGTVLNPGNTTGTLTNVNGTGVLNVAGNIAISNTVQILLNSSNAVTAGEISAASFTVDPNVAALTVANVGPDLRGGQVYHLFNKPVNFGGNVTLPTVTNTTSFVSNLLAVNGTIVIGSLVANTNPAPLTDTYTASNKTLTITWPTDHLGWHLQVLTNSAGKGLESKNWQNIPTSYDVTTMSFTNVVGTNAATNINSFYRLVFP